MSDDNIMGQQSRSRVEYLNDIWPIGWDSSVIGECEEFSASFSNIGIFLRLCPDYTDGEYESVEISVMVDNIDVVPKTFTVGNLDAAIHATIRYIKINSPNDFQIPPVHWEDI